MPASITDKNIKQGNGTQPLPTQLSAQKNSGASTASLVVATGWDTTTAKHLRMFQTKIVNGVTVPDQTTLSYYKATLSGTTLSNLLLIWSATGSDQTYPAGSTVDLSVTSGMIDDLYALIAAHANQDGTLITGAVSSAAILASDVVTTAKILNVNVTNAKLAADISPAKFANPYKFRTSRNAAANTGSGAYAVISFDTEQYDTGNNVAAGVFTAPVAGFYHFDWQAKATLSGGANEVFYATLFVNGAAYSEGSTNNAMIENASHGSDTVQLAGSDTVDVRTICTTARVLTVGSPVKCYFSGFLVSAT